MQQHQSINPGNLYQEVDKSVNSYEDNQRQVRGKQTSRTCTVALKSYRASNQAKNLRKQLAAHSQLPESPLLGATQVYTVS